MEPLVSLVAATSILVIIPGPNVALIVANSLYFGLRMGVMTVLGTTAGVALQLAFVVGGMAAVLELAAESLTLIRWLGVIYLIWLGIRTWRQSTPDLADVEAAPAMFWRGCMLAVMNPKTLLFNAAFLPQFVGGGSVREFVLAGGVFLAVLFLGDAGWAIFASSARRLLRCSSRWRNKMTGAFLIAAGIGLGLARRT